MMERAEQTQEQLLDQIIDVASQASVYHRLSRYDDEQDEICTLMQLIEELDSRSQNLCDY